MKKIWIATFVDRGEIYDGKARVLAVCATEEEARSEVRADIEKWAADRARMPIVVDFDKMSAKYDWKTFDDDDGREWNVEEAEIPE